MPDTAARAAAAEVATRVEVVRVAEAWSAVVTVVRAVVVAIE